ncbi:MAG: thrombospondin type 3 repeat-containing protein [Candidatus Hydrogenedentes bacterium]|nr:thrombospondin type 3 repeat-containing protein [Candidatus Hydrogenedentota bacterium]
MKHSVYTCMIVVLVSLGAVAGTANMNFVSDVGLLTSQSGAGSLVASGGRAVFTGQNVSLMEEDETLISTGGVVSVTMTLRPSTDAVNLVGIVMAAPGGDTVEAVCDGDGYVTLTDYIGNYGSWSFPYATATNNYFTLTYNATPGYGRATLSLNGVERVFLEDALEGATSVYVGVEAGGPGGFYTLSATAPGIPDYPEPDSDGDGVSDPDETAAGTDPDDPGSRPVEGEHGATVTGLNGASVMFPAESFSGTINAGIASPGSIPAGTVPGGKILSDAGLELTPNGTTFTSPVSVTMPYAPAQIEDLDPATLTPLYYDAGSYSPTGIAGVSVNTTARRVSFTTSHFTLFALAGDLMDSDSDGTPDIYDAFPFNPNGQTDSDADGIGDEWELDWFGDLTTADETTDYDSDGVSDLQEFEVWCFNFDPTDGLSSLPAAGIAGLAAAAALISAAARRRLRRH